MSSQRERRIKTVERRAWRRTWLRWLMGAALPEYRQAVRQAALPWVRGEVGGNNVVPIRAILAVLPPEPGQNFLRNVSAIFAAVAKAKGWSPRPEEGTTP